jgi:hypothetical protein
VSECVGGDVEGEEDRRVQGVRTQTSESGFAGPRRKVPEGPNARERICWSPTEGSRRTAHARERSHIPRPDFVVLRDPAEITEERPKAPEASTVPDDQDQDEGDRAKFFIHGKSGDFLSLSLYFCFPALRVLVRIFFF